MAGDGDGAYFRPEGLTAALTRMAARPLRPLAGGTDLYPATAGQALSGDILDLTAIHELREIATERTGLSIGACATWSEIAAARLPPALRALKEAAREVGGWQIQNAGTIGGNLCNASPAADGVPPLLVLGAEVELASAAGTRRLPLSDFIAAPGRTGRRPDEILTSVLVPRAGMMGRSRFLKLGARKYLIISIVSVAVRVLEREGRIAEVAVAAGACSPVARRLPIVEAALTDHPVAGAAGRVRDMDVAADLSPIDDIRATAAYRLTAAAELIRRAVADLAEGGHG